MQMLAPPANWQRVPAPACAKKRNFVSGFRLELLTETFVARLSLEREKAIIARQSPTRSFYEAFGGDGLRHGNLNMTVDLNQSGSIAKGAR
jgi:hypothetical protein